MKKVKVAFFADCLIENYDGAIRTMYQLINRIDHDKFEFLFITGDGPQGQFDHQVVEVPSLTLPINSNYKMSLPFLNDSQLKKKLAQFDADIVHIATPSPLGHYGLQYAKQNQLPVISIYHTHYLSYVDYYFKNLTFLQEPTKNILIAKLRAFYNQCDRVYVPTQKMKESLSQIGIFNSHMKIWKRGLNRRVFSTQKRDVNCLRKLTGNAKQNLLFASRLVWEKNLETLINISKEIEKRNLPYNLIVAGDGYAREELELRMPEAFFLGNLSQAELGVLYASADVFVFPSVSETYGNVVAEAMASGLPCVIANGGGTVEFIKNGFNGFLCKPTEAEDYLEKVEDILSNDQLKEQFINEGFNQIKNLSWEALAQEYFDDLERMTQESFAIRA